MKNFKIKPLTKEQILISIDRLTRFKETEIKYLRVFTDIITSNLLEPKIKKSDIENLDYAILKDYTEKIINFSLERLGYELSDDYLINQRLYDYENSVFTLNDDVKRLLQNKINYKAATDMIFNDAPKNLLWLKELASAEDLRAERKNKKLRFPLEEIILVEGITEETLLPVFARILGYDFDENGIYVISAGGKNQVVKYFYQLVQNCRLPIFVLLDNDAADNFLEIKPKLRECDRVHLLKAGEFEDVLPDVLLKRTLEYATKNISLAPIEEIEQGLSRVEYLKVYFRHRGLHEFKKAEFAELVKVNIVDDEDVSDEIREIINELSNPIKNTETF